MSSSGSQFIAKIPFEELKLSQKTLGSGSYGTVYRGRWRNQWVAVKEYKTRDEINSFEVEVEQLSRVNHPNIVHLLGASRTLKNAYLIMEFADYGSLNYLLHERSNQHYDLKHACHWAFQTALGVSYLHAMKPKPIMHRDLKPANLLLFDKGKKLKICDFGTACSVKTNMTNNTGSAAYMAPEVFGTSSYHESGDVYSWSIIFWEILARRNPYSDPHPIRILWNMMKGVRPRELESCPPIIWRLITRSWDKDYKVRPKMCEVADKMKRICQVLSSDINSSTRISSQSSKGDQQRPMHYHAYQIVTSQSQAEKQRERDLNFRYRALSYRLSKAKDRLKDLECLPQRDELSRFSDEVEEREELRKLVASKKAELDRLKSLS